MCLPVHDLADSSLPWTSRRLSHRIRGEMVAEHTFDTQEVGNIGWMEIHAVMREDGSGRWSAMTDSELSIGASGVSRARCLASLRRSIERRVGKSLDGLTLIVEVLPRLAGVAEAAEITGWDKRRVV